MPLATGFFSLTELHEHFQRHGSDFNAVDAWDYEQKAIVFLNSPRSIPGIHECQRQHGHQDLVRFNELTDEFAIMRPNGTIRTYYIPIPRHLAPPGTPARKTHPYRTNLEYFQEACRR